MSGAPDERAYLLAVQELYLGLRGGGLTLSPLDVERIRGWWQAGIPLDLALQGVRAAHAAWAAGGSRLRPFALRQAERHVAELAAGWERRGGARHGVGRREAPVAREPTDRPGSDRLARCIGRLETRGAGGPPAVRAAYEAAVDRLRRSASLPLDTALLAADEAQAFAYLRALDRPTQRRLAQRARAEAGPRSGMPRSSYRAMMRATLREAALRHGGLIRASDLT